MKKNTTAHTKAYEFIRDKILNGQLSSGTKLVEERLADELGVSRTPIRESIRKLEQEGLIKNKKVFTPTEADLRNIFQIRILLEGFACRNAALYMSEEVLKKLETCVHIGRTGTTEEIMKANKEFHDLIVQSSNNPVMVDIIDRMQSIIYLFRKTVVLYKRPFLIDEHEAICQAIREHDSDKAESLMKDHLQADLDFCLHLLKQ